MNPLDAVDALCINLAWHAKCHASAEVVTVRNLDSTSKKSEFHLTLEPQLRAAPFLGHHHACPSPFVPPLHVRILGLWVITCAAPCIAKVSGSPMHTWLCKHAKYMICECEANHMTRQLSCGQYFGTGRIMKYVRPTRSSPTHFYV